MTAQKKSLLRIVTSIILLFSFSACKDSGTSPLSDAEYLAIVNGTLIDGTGAEPIENAAVIIQGSYILAAGPSTQVNIPEGSKIIDMQGCTILPGFINAHVHDAYSEDNLKAWAQAGVTTVRDEGIISRNSTLAELISKRNSDWNKPQCARLVSAGWMITAPGGYGWMYVSSPDEARQKTNEEIDQGADLIKAAVEDGYGPRSDLPLLSTDALKEIVAAAHERNKLVSAHITEARFLQRVVDAGVNDAAHIAWDYMSDNLIRQMIEKQIYLVPTLTVMDAYRVVSGSLTNLKRFVDMGGKAALGNDYTNIPQNNFNHFELGMPMYEIDLMSKAGMSPMQIIVAATNNAAHVCGLGKELGTLEAGKTADLLIVTGNPLSDLQALTKVKMVIHNGIIIRE